MDDQMESNGLAPLKKPKPVALIAALTATAAAGGMGMYAKSLHGQRDDAKAQIAKLTETNTSQSNELELLRGEKTDLDTKMTACTNDLTTQKTSFTEVDQKRSDLDVQLTTCQASVKDLKDEKAQADQLLAEFKSITGRFQKMIDAGKLQVEFRRGQMVVKLPAAILFGSGSADLSNDGKAALADVAAVLKQVPGRRFTVAGHTDNQSAVGSKFADNWELSAARAVKVTELLVTKGISASRLVAAGYGEWDPIASNGTLAGQQKNRRIEIILEPDLRPVPDVKPPATPTGTAKTGTAKSTPPKKGHR
jgi:chemotaxis protein MotB